MRTGKSERIARMPPLLFSNHRCGGSERSLRAANLLGLAVKSLHFSEQLARFNLQRFCEPHNRVNPRALLPGLPDRDVAFELHAKAGR